MRPTRRFLPEAAGFRKIEFAVQRYPQAIRRLSVLPDGRIFATTEGYGQAVLLDPSKGTRQPLGDTMSIYSQVEVGGLIYMCGYPSSQLWVYDPNKPWTLRSSERSAADHFSRSDVDVPPGETVDPDRLAMLSEVTHSHMHMPMGGIFEGNDGRIYCGGKIIRTGNGGGLGWWDPKTETGGGSRKPFSATRSTGWARPTEAAISSARPSPFRTTTTRVLPRERPALHLRLHPAGACPPDRNAAADQPSRPAGRGISRLHDRLRHGGR